MLHRATADFWHGYGALLPQIRERADQKFSLLKVNPQHPSLQFKKVGERSGHEVWSVRVTLNYRALAIRRPYGYLWYWIGRHATYESLIS